MQVASTPEILILLITKTIVTHSSHNVHVHISNCKEVKRNRWLSFRVPVAQRYSQLETQDQTSKKRESLKRQSSRQGGTVRQTDSKTDRPTDGKESIQKFKETHKHMSKQVDRQIRKDWGRHARQYNIDENDRPMDTQTGRKVDRHKCT